MNRRFPLDNDANKNNDAKNEGSVSLPFPISNVQRACLYLHDWQRQNCCQLRIGQNGVGKNARRCQGGCEMPSVGMVEIGAGVRHNAAQRARKRIKESAASPCLKCTQADQT